MGIMIAGGFRVPRHAPVKEQVYLNGIDLTGGTLRAQVRAAAEAAGDPLINLATVTMAGTQGLRFVAVDTTSAPYPITQFELCIDKATIEGLPQGAQPDDDVRLACDFHLTPSGGLEQAAPTFDFIVVAGVTR